MSQEKTFEKQPRYKLRKLACGLVSCLSLFLFSQGSFAEEPVEAIAIAEEINEEVSLSKEEGLEEEMRETEARSPYALFSSGIMPT